MQTAVQAGDREFLMLLLRQGPASVAELCEAMSVTATAIRQRLARLTRLELIQRQAHAGERGRPKHEYELTVRGRRLVSDNAGLLARQLWESVRSIDDTAVRQGVLDRLQSSLANEYRVEVQGQSLRQRMQGLAAVLSERGFHADVHVDEENQRSLPVLREHACPYEDIAARDTSICDFEQRVFSEVLGTSLELTRCCQRGDRTCEFQPVTS